jgi:hypothetical protein
MKTYLTFCVLFTCFLLASCVKDTKIEPLQPNQKDTTQLIIDFTAMANAEKLVSANKTYTNSSGDFFSVNMFNYYISNVKLTDEDGSVFTEPESYHLIKHVEGKTSFTIKKLPTGNYTHIEFLIGVDSIRNISGAQVGALDVANQMFWEWESGYIFFKLEGNYVSSSVTTEEGYAIHIGGFKGEFKCLQTVKLNLNTILNASKAKPSKIHINTIVDEIFKTPKHIGFDSYYGAIGDPMFKSISENYKDMFVVTAVE